VKLTYFILATILLLPFLIDEIGSAAPEHHFNPSYNGTKGLVSIGFDHAFLEQFNASSYMHSKGILGTFFVVTERVGRPVIMDYDQLRFVQSHGFEIMSHTQNHYPHANETTYDPNRIPLEIVDSKQILISEGFDVIGFAPPLGYLNDELLVAIIANYQYTGQLQGPIGDFNSLESLSQIEQMNGIRTFVTTSITSAEYTIDDVKDLIDTAIEQKYYLTLNFHKLVKSNPIGNETTISMFKEIIHYMELKINAGLLDNNTIRGALGF